MKIGIVTINSTNLGNRLQNYAVQRILRNMGHEPYTMNNTYCGSEVTTLKHTLKICVVNRALPSLFSKRREAFEAFNEKYIRFDDSKWAPGVAPEGITDKFDYFLCGSDQVWNPTFEFLTDNEYLTFARPEQKVAISASIAVSEIPSDKLEVFKRRTSNFKAISVREDAGAKILKDIHGIEVPVLVDPTMVLSKKEWLEISSPSPVKPKGKYILTYFLGNKKDETKAFIDKIAREQQLEVVNLWDAKVKRYFHTNPSQFLDYVANCSLMCSDSFHASIFSIIMGVPFVVFERKDNVKKMSSRLETLLGKLDLKHHHYQRGMDVGQVLEADYTKAYKVLESEREKVTNYLNKAFS